jgi:hypothetical protein
MLREKSKALNLKKKSERRTVLSVIKEACNEKKP